LEGKGRRIAFWERRRGNAVPNVLVADDNTNIQKMVALALEERGIKVVSVGNGEAAVRRIPDVNPDLVLADIFMPVRNGYEVCEFVKKDERFAHVPVILLVGAFDPLDEKEARRVGADGVLKKPFVPPDPLIAMVTSALEKNPRVAAELAKAKEPKAVETIERPPVEQSEIPARSEPKPLPEFPEPSPEEAALVYGFGTGHRAPNGDEDEAESATEPQAPIVEAEAVSEDEYDGASTANDWRRTAMDFEVPEDIANRPAFPAVEDLDPITFPSERDVPPRRVRVLDMAEESKPIAQEKAVESAEARASSPAVVEAPAAEHVPESTPTAKQGKREIEEAPASESAAERTPNVASGTPHWMDAVTAPSPEYPDGGWMAALTGEHVEPSATDESGASHILPASPPSNTDSEELFFADDAAADESSSGSASRIKAPADAVAPDKEIELEPDDTEPPLALKDPALVEPPAVHVSPEPLLVDEEPQGPSTYGASPQETTPLHSFASPAPEDPVLDEPRVRESAAPAETEALSPEPASHEVDERVPTMPPPNREALAGIPFLTPPQAASHSDEGGATAVDTSTVNAVVQKVLEKLEPQLHDLLSQGVLKPLVENLLQNELAKKEK
jgi:CheY-like chemotaxis protein